MVATGGTVGLAKGIIDDSCLVLSLFRNDKCIKVSSKLSKRNALLIDVLFED